MANETGRLGRQNHKNNQDNTHGINKKGKKIMKKIIMTVVSLLSMTTTFAEKDNMNMTDAYTMDINHNSLSRALSLSNDQLEEVKDIHAVFRSDMIIASAADKADRKALTDYAIRRDLKYMAAVLTREQYRTYISILNATMLNRGLMFGE